MLLTNVCRYKRVTNASRKRKIQNHSSSASKKKSSKFWDTLYESALDTTVAVAEVSAIPITEQVTDISAILPKLYQSVAV